MPDRTYLSNHVKENSETLSGLYILAAQLMTSSEEMAGMLTECPPMLLNSMATLRATFSSGASDIHTASYGPSVKKPWWNFTPHDSAVFMCCCMVIASSLAGGLVFFTSVTNHIAAGFARTLYIRRFENLTQIGD